MQGIFIHGRRPKSKKEVREHVAANPRNVRIEATALVHDEYDGSVAHAPDGTYNFVGPDPERSRKFYGTITVRDGKAAVQ